MDPPDRTQQLGEIELDPGEETVRPESAPTPQPATPRSQTPVPQSERYQVLELIGTGKHAKIIPTSTPTGPASTPISNRTINPRKAATIAPKTARTIFSALVFEDRIAYCGGPKGVGM